YGTGQLIKKALDEGFTSFILALGGSATNDGGIGMLQALGLGLQDDNGKDVGYGGRELDKISKIDLSCFDQRINQCEFIIASDVENPLIGINGASYVFGPQKGANPEMVKSLDKKMTHWADKVAEFTNIYLHDLA